jgi:phage-related protein
MTIKWKLIFYTTSSGQSPIDSFIGNLDLDTQARVFNSFELLQEYGAKLKGKHVKKLTGTSLWELRVLGSQSIRIFYVAYQSQTFLLLHGFQKQSKKTPNKEIKIALKRLAEYIL